jgi:hypothetical protein
MGLDVSKLVMVAQDTDEGPGKPGKGNDDADFLGFADTWATYVLGCTSRCVKTFTSYADFLTKLKSYDHISQLAILSHSGKTNLSFPAGVNALAPKDLDEIVADLGTPVPVVDSLEFLGCAVGLNVSGVHALGAKLTVKSAIAFNFAHIFEPRNVKVDPGDDGAVLRDRIGDDEYRYLVAANPYTNVERDAYLDGVAAHPGPEKKVQVWIEWFRVLVGDQDAQSVGTPFDKEDPIQHRKNYRRRSEARQGSPTGQHIQVFSQTEAQTLEQKFKRLTEPPFTKVEVIKAYMG